MKNKLKIGIFDSSIGGISVLKEALKLNLFPEIEYLADTKYYPYGEKDETTIKERIIKIADFFQKRENNILIIACSTASAIYEKHKKEIKNIFKGKIYTMLNRSLCEEITRSSKNKNIGIISTSLTAKNGYFKKYIQTRTNNLKITVKAAPLLIEKITLGKHKSKETYLLAEKYLNPFVKDNDAIVLGCTHFHFTSKIIKKICYPKKIIEPAPICIKHIMKDLKLQKSLVQNTNIHFLCTKDLFNFKSQVNIFFESKKSHLKYSLVQLEKISDKLSFAV